MSSSDLTGRRSSKYPISMLMYSILRSFNCLIQGRIVQLARVATLSASLLPHFKLADAIPSWKQVLKVVETSHFIIHGISLRQSINFLLYLDPTIFSTPVASPGIQCTLFFKTQNCVSLRNNLNFF